MECSHCGNDDKSLLTYLGEGVDQLGKDAPRVIYAYCCEVCARVFFVYAEEPWPKQTM